MIKTITTGAKRFLKVSLWGIGLIVIFILVINVFIDMSTRDKKIELDQVNELVDNQPVVMVLGAGVTPTKEPSNVLKERLDKAADVYQHNKQAKFIMSGDHRDKYYDEVTVMKNYLIEQHNIPSEQIYLDHLGVNTFNSVYRLKHIFQQKKHIVIVTQSHHLSRALLLASSLDLDTVGIVADSNEHFDILQVLRESIASVKAVIEIYTPLKPNVIYKDSSPVDMSRSGDETNQFY